MQEWEGIKWNEWGWQRMKKIGKKQNKLGRNVMEREGVDSKKSIDISLVNLYNNVGKSRKEGIERQRAEMKA